MRYHRSESGKALQLPRKVLRGLISWGHFGDIRRLMMAGEVWVPLSDRESPHRLSQRVSVLYEGIPDWLHQAILDWLHSIWMFGHSPVRGNLPWQQNFLRTIEVRLRRRLPFASIDWREAGEYFAAQLGSDPDYMLDVVDLSLAILPSGSAEIELRRDLDALLRAGGSVWHVEGGTGRQLIRRVDATVQQMVEDAARAGDRAASHLQRAYAAGFGRNPMAGTAYREAVRAVEAALRPIVSPTNPRATLGSMVAEMRDHPDRFAVRLRASDGFNGVGSFKDMLRLLWTSQLDRHGTDDDSAPMDVTLEQAQDAVFLAAMTIQWVTSGAFRRTGSAE